MAQHCTGLKTGNIRKNEICVNQATQKADNNDGSDVMNQAMNILLLLQTSYTLIWTYCEQISVVTEGHNDFNNVFRSSN